MSFKIIFGSTNLSKYRELKQIEEEVIEKNIELVSINDFQKSYSKISLSESFSKKTPLSIYRS